MVKAYIFFDKRAIAYVERLTHFLQYNVGLDMFFLARMLKIAYVVALVFDVLASGYEASVDAKYAKFGLAVVITSLCGTWMWKIMTRHYIKDPIQINSCIMKGLSNPNKINFMCIFNRAWLLLLLTFISAMGGQFINWYHCALFILSLWQFVISGDPLPQQPSKLKEFVSALFAKQVPISPST